MARIALVTGGTRGIGRAIAIALKADGCDVAAVYRGNDEAAKQLETDQGIRTYKWDVGDFDACASGIAQVEREVGPVDVLVNNAGITSDVTVHDMNHTAIRCNDGYGGRQSRGIHCTPPPWRRSCLGALVNEAKRRNGCRVTTSSQHIRSKPHCQCHCQCRPRRMSAYSA